jgi:hypothetical protein
LTFNGLKQRTICRDEHILQYKGDDADISQNYYSAQGTFNWQSLYLPNLKAVGTVGGIWLTFNGLKQRTICRDQHILQCKGDDADISQSYYSAQGTFSLRSLYLPNLKAVRTVGGIWLTFNGLKQRTICRDEHISP